MMSQPPKVADTLRAPLAGALFAELLSERRRLGRREYFARLGRAGGRAKAANKAARLAATSDLVEPAEVVTSDRATG